MSDESTATDLTETLSRRRSLAPLLFLLLVGLCAWLLLSQQEEETAPVEAPVTVAEPAAPSVSAVEPEPATPAATPEANADIEELKSRLAAQEERIAALEARSEQTPKEGEGLKSGDVVQMSQQIAEQRLALENLRAETRTQGLPVRQLQLWVLLQQVAQGVDQGGAVALPVAQLQEAWVGSAAGELEALRTLARIAEQRVPAIDSLTRDFVQLRGDVSVGLLQKEVGLWGRLKAMLREQIRVRRLDAGGNAEPADALAALDEAQDALSEGDVEEAIRLIQSIPQGRSAFESWLASAQRRLDAQAAVRELQQSLLTQLTALPKPGAAQESVE